MLGPQFLFKQLGIFRDHMIRRGKNALARAIVLLELDQLDLRIVGRQLGQIFDRRTAPGIDRLVIITDRREHRAWTRQPLHESVLTDVCVLILVHQEITYFFLPLLSGFDTTLKNLRGNRDQIIKIHGLIRSKRRVIAAVDTRRLDLTRCRGDVGSGIRIQHGIFPKGNRLLNRAQAPPIRRCKQVLNNR